MTISQMQAARDALYTQYLKWINAGCPQAYTINNRSVTKCDSEFWLSQIGTLEQAIARASSTSGVFSAAQFRNP